MKKARVFASSLAAAAASSIVLGSKSDRLVAIPHDSNEGLGSSKRNDGSERGSGRGGEREKFAPRFDGLRFIETLVTAHR